MVLEPTNPKASRPPPKAGFDSDYPPPRGGSRGSNAGGGNGAAEGSKNATRGGSMKQAAQSLLTAKA